MIRGLAALAVLVYHVDFAFGLRGRLLPAGYTAVDLFFILSGFVIATTYEKAIVDRAIDFPQLAIRRFARLYPLFLLTTLVGFFTMTVRYRTNFGFFDSGRLVISAIANLFVLPSPAAPYNLGVLFPFNAASWSIFYELVINVVFYFVFARMRTSGLVVLWIAAAAATAWMIARYGSIDIGWGAANFYAAFARVTFSFLTGMLIWRRYAADPWQSATWILCALVVTHFAYMQGRMLIPGGWAGVTDFLVIAGLLPLAVVAGVGVVMGRRWSKVAAWLGDTSYAVYLTQDALIIVSAGFTQYVLKTKIYDLGPAAGFALVGLCMIESYICFMHFEVPMRRWLRSAGRIERIRRFDAATAQASDRS